MTKQKVQVEQQRRQQPSGYNIYTGVEKRWIDLDFDWGMGS